MIRSLLPHKIHLVLIPVIHLELGQIVRVLRDQSSIANTSGVCEELFLEVFGDPLFDYDVVAVELRR